MLGVILAFVTGNGYVMESQVNWNTPLLPLCYLASGLTMGGAVYAAAQIAMPDEGEMQKAAGSVITVALLRLRSCKPLCSWRSMP